jgi:phosphoribosylaminoimidazolecarboxamide formyltransferase/IMP cyclohydrolase
MHKMIAVVVSASSYDQIIDEIKKHNGALSLATRERLAYEAFQQTADYDFTVSAYLGALQESQTALSSFTSFTIMSFPKGGSPSRNISDADITDDFSIEPFQGSLPDHASWSMES